MPLFVYNYLTRQKEEFTPVHEGFVGMYVCGPTVWGDAHLGHAKTYIFFDVLHRYLEYLGYRVRYVQNITDVGHLTDDADEGEDKVGRRARLERLEPMEIVETYTRNYFRDMDILNVRRPDISPRASGHVPEQVELAQMLIDKGYAYESNGSVFFSVRDWPAYGKLSGRKPDELDAARGGRLAVNPDKKDPRDFAVWRAATPDHLMQWNSPWGAGFPGWHAECTVMARKYLGLPFDIHGGGLENIFPHNESEIAQSEAAYGDSFARYWILSNMLTVNGTKMGKSLGNFITIQQALNGDHPALSQGYSPQAIRFLILSSHYRSTTDFTDESLQGAARGYERLVSAVTLVRYQLRSVAVDAAEAADESVLDGLAQHRERFLAAMNDDFNTPQAIATLFDLNKVVNTLLNSGQPVNGSTLRAIDDAYRALGGEVLGLIPEELTSNGRAALEGDLIQILIDLRASARRNKDWGTADAIRDRLAEIGVILEDRADGTVWKVAG